MRTARVRMVAATVAACALAVGCAVVPTYQASNTTFEGFPVITYVPANPAGIVYVFHGTGGSADFATKLETVDMLNHLVAQGYGFVSTESTNRTTKQWDTSSLSLSRNPDLARLSRLEAQLVSTHRIAAQTPIYAIGMSRGAGFASVFAQAFRDAGYPVAAIAPSHGQIPASVRASGGLDVPALFTLGANDPIVDNAQVTGQVADLVRRGVPAQLFVEPETLLGPARFLRVPGIDDATAQGIFATLVAAGLWDSSGRRLPPIPSVESTLPTLHYPTSVTTAQLQSVQDELNVVLAVHQYSATYADQTVAFFGAHR